MSDIENRRLVRLIQRESACLLRMDHKSRMTDDSAMHQTKARSGDAKAPMGARMVEPTIKAMPPIRRGSALSCEEYQGYLRVGCAASQQDEDTSNLSCLMDPL